MKAYLSGGMEHAKNFGAAWREEMQQWIENELGHKVFNPSAVSEKYLRKHYPGINQKRLKRTNLRRFKRLVSKLMELDCREIAERTDYVVCYWDESAQKGAGTKGELTMARYFAKPVYLVTSMKPVDVPGWIIACSSMMFRSFDEAKSFLRKKYRK